MGWTGFRRLIASPARGLMEASRRPAGGQARGAARIQASLGQPTAPSLSPALGGLSRDRISHPSISMESMATTRPAEIARTLPWSSVCVCIRQDAAQWQPSSASQCWRRAGLDGVVSLLRRS